MKDSFAAALAAVLKFEGGYSNHRNDPGGETMRGVTKRVYDAWRTSRGLKPRSVKFITDSEVAEIYRRQYWQAIRGDELPPGVDCAVFDAAVNSGPGRAAKWLQAALGVRQDGQIGLVTLGAARKTNAASLAAAVCDRRLSWLKGLKTWPTFGRGWSRRIRELKPLAIAMAS